MANMEKLQTTTVICDGGLDSNKNHIALSQNSPGAAIRLINFEPSIFGGYRKINGFEPLEADYETVDAAGSEGKILGCFVHDDGIIVARKTQSATTYKFFYWTSGADWTAYTTGLTHTATNVNRIRAESYNLQGPESIIFVDGVNGPVLYNGTNWVEMTTGATGADYANAGGAQVLAAPSYVTLFKNHLFISGDPTNPQIVAHSAPNLDYDWTSANGAGQLNVGFAVRQIKPFRDALYVFGETKIKKIVVDGDAFVVQDVTSNGGLMASDSVIEINGDLLFLSADGIRTIAGTERNEDVEVGNLAVKIRQTVIDLNNAFDMQDLTAVVIRSKTQFRYFYNNENETVASNRGVLGALSHGHPTEHSGVNWEWGEILGIRTSCATSGRINNVEYIIHGDFNGGVYRQETGNDFNGANITAVYQTPYLDFGDVFTRKTLHKVAVFIRPEDAVQATMTIRYDWGSEDVHLPASYLLEATITGDLYGTGVYGTARYATSPAPVIFKNVEGSNFSNSLTFTSSDTAGSFSIQAIIYEYSVNGRK